MFLCNCANSWEFSSSEEFDDREVESQLANLWTPEKGFESLTLKSNQNSWPRPGVGNITIINISN